MVLIAIKNIYVSELVSFCTKTELLAVDATIGIDRIRIIAGYVAHSNNCEYLAQLLKEIISLIENVKHYIILEDWNLPNIDSSMRRLRQEGTYSKKLVNDVLNRAQPIQQIVTIPTRNTHLLNVVLTNMSENISTISPFFPIGSSDHIVIRGELMNYKRNLVLNQRVCVKCFNKADYIKIGEFLTDALLQINTSTSCETAWSKFEKILFCYYIFHSECKDAFS